MQKLGILAFGLVLVSQGASGASWSAIGIAVQPQQDGKVVAAADALMSSPVGKEFPGRLFLQVSVADGDDPATHSFVPVYRTAVEREAWVTKLQADPAWAKFQNATSGISQGVSTVQYRTLKRWGDISDADILWQTHAFAVRDPAAFVAALDGFMSSETGKAFPGQVFLSSVVAGGMTPVTHVVSVGFMGEGEREGWAAKMDGNADWDKYIAVSRKAADYLGNNMVRTVKTWGATLDEVTQ